MPGLVAFNRRWAIGTDDFVFPGFLEIFVRVIWLIAISVVYDYHGDSLFECDGGNFLRAYYIGLLALLCVCIVINTVIVYISMKGCIVNAAPRNKLIPVLYIKIIISIPELVWNIMGTYWSFRESKTCLPSVVKTAQGAVISGWILAVIVIIGILIIFDPLGRQNKRNPERRRAYSMSHTDADSAMVASRKAWERRLRFLCCCLIFDDQSKDAFTDISKLLTEFFKDLDLVPTDIAAGLILVQKIQENSYYVHSDKSYSTFSNTSESDTSSRRLHLGSRNGGERSEREGQFVELQSWMNTKMMSHYMKFALGSYGWPLYVFDHLGTGVCRLCNACRCFSCLSGHGTIINDNCCLCNTAAIRKYTQIDMDDIVYASYHNAIYEIPFYIAIDRETQSVVVAIRGTLSFKDCLTDMTAECESLEMQCLPNTKAHKGILQAAEYVKSKLQENDRLQMAFQKAQGCRLVITGHSLGAGAAALLAILMKPEYPDLICYAFSPPGGLLSYNASQHSKDFICSVILGKDIIPRLGLVTMETLKLKILQAIRDTNLPKYQILASGVWQIFCGCFDNKCCMSNAMQTDETLISDPCSMEIRKMLETAIEDTTVKMEQYKQTNTHFYPPGQILHIQEVESGRRCFETPTYYAEWKEVEDFDTILVSPDMLSDHLPDNVFEALDQLQRRNFTPKYSARKSNLQETTVDM